MAIALQGEINEKGTMRELLYTNWASVKKWYRYQPLDDIKEYFGVKIGKSSGSRRLRDSLAIYTFII